MLIEKLNEGFFTWSLWRAGSPLDLGIRFRCLTAVEEQYDLIRKYAVGYCKSESMLCRPKEGYYALMFQKGDLQFWTHIKEKEFRAIFPELEDKDGRRPSY